MADDAYDPAFAALSSHLQERIDAAFDTAQLQGSDEREPARKRRKVEHSPEPQAGGFLVDEPAPGGFVLEQPAPGGFLVDDTGPHGGGFVPDRTSDNERHTHIPLSLIPTALQILDLPPDDEDVLSVFQNAASGWSEHKRGRPDVHERGSNQEDGGLVSRKDWRAVCAALLDTGAGDREDVHMDGDGRVDRSPTGTDGPEEAEEAPSDSGEDYTRVSSSKGRKRRSTAGSDEEEEGKEDRGLSARQKKECRAAFSLFFPDVADAELDKQRIRIKDITRVAKLLKEKVTAEETVEMLEAFSTAADKSMSLGDFERMMIAARLA
ncbi:hypothetical protein GY45DRAFT_1242246 [Cubamyces sp. BRFM 1775]|nr:hypothetical protein GY45DRAFT_1242246 [Cubamyces sp. BRFM 1775]